MSNARPPHMRASARLKPCSLGDIFWIKTRFKQGAGFVGRLPAALRNVLQKTLRCPPDPDLYYPAATIEPCLLHMGSPPIAPGGPVGGPFRLIAPVFISTAQSLVYKILFVCDRLYTTDPSSLKLHGSSRPIPVRCLTDLVQCLTNSIKCLTH